MSQQAEGGRYCCCCFSPPKTSPAIRQPLISVEPGLHGDIYGETKTPQFLPKETVADPNDKFRRMFHGLESDKQAKMSKYLANFLENELGWPDADYLSVIILSYICDLPIWIEVSGRVGMNGKLNGRYKQGKHKHEGRVFYYKPNTGWVIRYYPDRKQWIFDKKGLRQTGRGCCKVNDENALDPSQVQSAWRAFDGKKSVEDPNIKITAISYYED